MTDLTEIYEEGDGPPRYVVRLSRTATGSRTYTVGMSLAAPDIDTDAVTALFRLEKAVMDVIDGKATRSSRHSGQNVAANLRRSIIVEVLRKADLNDPGTQITTEQIRQTLNPQPHRSQLVADLSALVKAGVLDKTEAPGKPSRYRLVTK